MMRRNLLSAALAVALAACGDTAPEDAAASGAPAAQGTTATTNAEVQPVPGSSAGQGPSQTASNAPMSATSTPIPADAAPSACGADKAAKFVGRIATPDVRAQVIEAVGHNRIRWIGPDTVVTMDFSEERLNMSLDASNRITGSKCG